LVVVGSQKVFDAGTERKGGILVIETDIKNMDGVFFEMTPEILCKIRDRAVEATIEAQIQKEKWCRSVLMFSERQLRKQLGGLAGIKGTIAFSDGDLSVILDGIEEPSWFQLVCQVTYRRKLKSGKFSKHVERVDASYIQLHFSKERLT
jgi:hypothetical protein